MEHSGTGGYDGHDITKRVGKLEISVDQLHQDSARTQAALAGLQSGQDALARVVQDIASKLDAHRTKRPELGAMAGVASVIIMLGAATLWPVNQRLLTTESNIREMNAVMMERAELIGQIRADKEYLLEQIHEHHSEISAMKNNRFTKQDGQRLEDRINGLHDQ